jgi:4-oxalocrotonate tautomerase
VTTTPKKTMPHVIVKLLPGKSEEQKTRLAEEITKDVMDILHYGEEAVSVAIEEIEPQVWAEKVIRRKSLPVRKGSTRN